MPAKSPSKSASSQVIDGGLFPATGQGFRLFLAEANRMTARGYDLVALVRLKERLASVYRLRAPTHPRPSGSFFEDL